MSENLRVAIIGSGPSGFYAAERLLKESNITVDMFERLPTPYGLVRGGVAPDHQKIKSVTRVYDRIAEQPRFRFFGHVEFGTDLSLADLEQHYHAIIYAVGAQTDRPLGIPGEDLPGSHAATEFVAWYNAHPDYHTHKFNLNVENVAVVGLGNVAMDVIRILSSTYDELHDTDIADYALEALSHSTVRNIYVLGRRGPAQAAFTNPEIKELGEMVDAEIVVAPSEVELDPYTQEALTANPDRLVERNLQTLRAYAQRPPQGKKRRIILRFMVSPVEIIGEDRVQGIRIVHNELYRADDGSLRSRGTDTYETLPVGLVFRSVGYRGKALPDVPFDDRAGVIPNDHGRVLTAAGSSQTLTGNYVVGWIKRGPSGIIGTNKPDSIETVENLLADAQAGRLNTPATPAPEAINALLQSRGVAVVSYEDWHKLDQLEQEYGAALNRPRLKFSRVEDMLRILESEKGSKA